MLLEERHYNFSEILKITNSPAISIFMIPADNTTAHCCTQTMQKRDIAFVLYYGQLRKDLITKPGVGMFADANMKTPFAINESGYRIRRELL